ncbi:MAG: hypothetical protein QM765_43055 [Myxococcales bacterium]
MLVDKPFPSKSHSGDLRPACCEEAAVRMVLDGTQTSFPVP